MLVNFYIVLILIQDCVILREKLIELSDLAQTHTMESSGIITTCCIKVTFNFPCNFLVTISLNFLQSGVLYVVVLRYRALHV